MLSSNVLNPHWVIILQLYTLSVDRKFAIGDKLYNIRGSVCHFTASAVWR